MNLSTSTIGSMRTRSTSDMRSKDERGTNEPWEVHLELRADKGTKIEWASLLNDTKFGRIFFRVSLVGPRLRKGRSCKGITLSSYQNKRGGRQKGAEK